MTKRIPYILISLTIGILLYNLLLGSATTTDFMNSLKGVVVKILFVLSTITAQGIILSHYVNKKTNRFDFLFTLTAVISVILIVDYIDFGLTISAYKQTSYVIPENLKKITGNDDPIKNYDPFFNFSIIEIIPLMFQILLFVIRQKNKATPAIE